MKIFQVGCILSFSYVGLKDKEEKVNGRTIHHHHHGNRFQDDRRSGGDRAWNTASRTQTGAVSAVKVRDMIKTKNEN